MQANLDNLAQSSILPPMDKDIEETPPLQVYPPAPLNAAQAVGEVIQHDMRGDPDWTLTPSARIELVGVMQELTARATKQER